MAHIRSRGILALCGIASVGCSSGIDSEVSASSSRAALSTQAAEKAELEAWLVAQNIPNRFVRERLVTEHDEFDCVDWKDQPALRGRGRTAAATAGATSRRIGEFLIGPSAD